MVVDKDFLIKNKKSLESGSCVYFLLKGDEVVYIGHTRFGVERIGVHKQTKDFDSYVMIPCSVVDMERIEMENVLFYKPEYNQALRAEDAYSLKKTQKILGNLGFGHIRLDVLRKIVLGMGIRPNELRGKEYISLNAVERVANFLENEKGKQNEK